MKIKKIKTAAFAFILILTALCSCTRQIYVPIEKVSTQTKYDSIYTILKDSVFINQYTKGDTVYLEKYKCLTNTEYKDRFITKCDSIPVPYEVIVEKPYIPKFIRYYVIISFMIFVFYIQMKIINKTRKV